MMKIKNIILAAAATSLISIQMASAGIEVLYGNTVVLTTITPQGENTTSLFYNADGSVTTDSGATHSWEIKGDQLCTQFSFTPPNGKTVTQNACSPLAEMEGAAPGDTWEVSPSEGVTIKGKIVAGR